MLGAGYFHPFSSRVAASVVVIDNDREGQRSGYQLPPVAGQNSIKNGSFLQEQTLFTSSYCNAYYNIRMKTVIKLYYGYYIQISKKTACDLKL
jgi:hypothetical protein